MRCPAEHGSVVRRAVALGLPGRIDLVVWRVDRSPEWLPRSALPEPVAQQGRYAVMEVRDLLDALRRAEAER